jgi:hypothetical protein
VVGGGQVACFWGGREWKIEGVAICCGGDLTGGEGVGKAWGLIFNP